MKLKKRNIIILLAAFVAVLAWAVYEDGLDNLLEMFRMLNPFWLAVALVFMVLYWALESSILFDITKCFHPAQRFRNSVTTSMLGQLFNCITPFSSGGQPVQAYHMYKTGVPLGIASCALMAKFIIYQLCLTIYSMVVLLFYWKPLSRLVSGFAWLVFIGFAINFAVMVGLICVCFFRRFTRFITTGCVRLLAKLHIIKDKEEKLVYVERELSEFHRCFAAIKARPAMMLRSSLLSFAQLTAFFLIPYFICLAFGIENLSIMMALSAQSFVVMISCFVPLPGAAGGAEFSFHTFFSPFFPQGMSVNPAMLLWRLITFYLPILVGICFMVFDSKSKEAVREAEHEDILPESEELSEG